MPLQTRDQYHLPPQRLDVAGSIRKGQVNRLGEMAIKQAPERFRMEKETFQREQQVWKTEDQQKIRGIIAGYMGNLDVTDPAKFKEQASLILPQIANDLAQAYGQRAEDAIASLKVMADDVHDPNRLPQVMNMASVYKSMLAGQAKPMNPLDQAKTLKTLKEISEPDKPETTLGKLIAEYNDLPADSPDREFYKQRIEKEVTRSGERITVNPDGTITLERGGAVGEMGKKVKGKVEEKLFNAAEQRSRLEGIAAIYQPKYHDAWFKVEQGLRNLGEKYLRMELDPEEKAELEAYSAYKRRVISNLNLYIKEITGAQMSEAEAKRLGQAVPKTEDGPTVFSGKLLDVLREAKLGIARYSYYLNKGMSEANIQKIIEEEKAVGLYDIQAIMAKREQQLVDQGLEPEQIMAKMKEEFGL